jgi:hypothetical protein
MDEPSVLDYVKSKLKFRKPGSPVINPQEPIPEIGQIDDRSTGMIPWRAILAMVLALVGQRMFENPERVWETGFCFYLVSAGLLIWSARRGEWELAPDRKVELTQDPLSINLPALIAAGIFGLAAFATFGGNLFNPLNLTLWILAIIFLFRAFWLHQTGKDSTWEKLKNLLDRGSWRINISRRDIMVFLAIVLVVFFRTYQVSGVPPEPFSDHAEKILDVYDITQGQTHIFFPRNTGRESFQMYLTVAVAGLFGTGLSFLSLKIGTVICGLATLPYMFLLGNEIGNRRVGLLAFVLTGIAYWPNVISRLGLRFPLYPLFAAPVLYYLIRGLRRSTRNDFILAGFFLGLGLHGYSPFRIMPILVIVGMLLYLVHRQSKGNRRQLLIWLGLIAITSGFVFLPLLRYWIQNPEAFAYRAFSRLGDLEQPLHGAWWQILFSNTWNAVRMVNWSDGEIWVNSIPYRPALDVVCASLFVLGSILVFIRYLRDKNWLDIFIIVSIPILMLPSILSLAYPAENPALNRAAGAYVPIFIIVALALEGLLTGIQKIMKRNTGKVLAWALVGILCITTISQNFDLVFNQFRTQYQNNAWNSSEMGQVIQQFADKYGSTDNTWIIPFPYWVDTRLPGIWVGIPNRDFAIWIDKLADSELKTGEKLFIFNIEDREAGSRLQTLYPQGTTSRFTSKTQGHDFMIFFVPELQ